MQSKILVLFAHPLYERSLINKNLCKAYKNVEGITLHDLYEAYPDFEIDTKYEKSLLLNHDIIIWHHPFYWYSCPPLLKQWIDIVLEFKWAYGPEGVALQGKFVIQTISAGGTQLAYSSEGGNKYPIRQYLIPFQQTANLCKMSYLPPFVVYDSNRADEDQIKEVLTQYKQVVAWLQSDDFRDISADYELMNDFLTEKN